MFSLLQTVTNGTEGVLPPITVDALLGDFTVLLVLSACIVGVAWRTLGKYWDKWRDGEITSFDRTFIATAITAFVVAVTPALALLPSAVPMFIASLGQYGIIIAWFVVAGWAYGLNEAVNYTYKRVERRAEKQALSNIDKKIEERVQAVLEKQNQSQPQ